MRFIKIGSSYTTNQLPRQFSNQVYYSEHSALMDFSYQSTYSLKYVLTGFERYTVLGQEQIIRAKEFLLVNNKSEVCTKDAYGKAMSIFIAPETLTDVYSVIQARTVEQSLDQVAPVDRAPVFRNGVYSRTTGRTGKLLEELALFLSGGVFDENQEINAALFFRLSEAILADQKSHSERLNNLAGPKPATIQEQYERLLIGQAYLHDNLNQPFSLERTAKAALLSPYHFHRLFRQSFSVTPYQYHLALQMEEAMRLLEKDFAVSEVSSDLGFNNVNSFRRAFKKYFRLNPSQVRWSKER